MQVERVTLKDGSWADAHTRPSHGQIKAFYRKFRGLDDADMMSSQDALIEILVESWSLAGTDFTGKPTREAIDEAPQELVDELTTILSGYLNKDEAVPGEG